MNDDGGDDALTLGNVCLKTNTRGGFVRVGFELLNLGHKGKGFQKLINSLASMRRGLDKLDITTHRVGDEAHAI